jgi:hypothetical protein
MFNYELRITIFLHRWAGWGGYVLLRKNIILLIMSIPSI